MICGEREKPDAPAESATGFQPNPQQASKTALHIVEMRMRLTGNSNASKQITVAYFSACD
jgi:hypothetical protein